MRLQLERDALADAPLMEPGSPTGAPSWSERRAQSRVSRLDLGIALGTAALDRRGSRATDRHAAPEGREPMAEELERETGLEPATSCLEGRRSTN